MSFFKALFAFAAFLYVLKSTGNIFHAQTLAFTMVGTGSLLYVFSTRHLSRPLWKDRLTKNPWLILAVVSGIVLQVVVIYHPWFSAIFKTFPLGISDWLIVALSGLLLIFINETTKFVFRKKIIG